MTARKAARPLQRDEWARGRTTLLLRASYTTRRDVILCDVLWLAWQAAKDLRRHYQLIALRCRAKLDLR